MAANWLADVMNLTASPVIVVVAAVAVEPLIHLEEYTRLYVSVELPAVVVFGMFA